MIKLLIQRGANKNAEHKDSLKAVDLARGKEEVVWLFEGGGGGRECNGDGGDGSFVAAGDAPSLNSSKNVSL